MCVQVQRMVDRCCTVTTLEVCLIVFNLVQTVVSGWVYMHLRKQVAHEKLLHQQERERYEQLVQTLPIGRSLL